MCFFFRLTLHPRRSTLFPYTTLFRSGLELRPLDLEGRHVRIGVRDVGAPTEERADDLVRRRLPRVSRSEEHTSELQSRQYLVCRLLLEKKKNTSTLS